MFEHVQVIATTHSPLVVGGMRAKQVMRFARDEHGDTVALEVTDEMLMGRADQLLTGRLFGMRSTLDPQTQGSIHEYEQLLGKEKRTEPEEARFKQLSKDLQLRVPLSRETPPERKAQELVNALLEAQIGDKVPDQRELLLKKTTELIKELQPPTRKS